MIQTARGTLRAMQLCGVLLLPAFVTACDGGKPPGPAAVKPAPKPVAIAPPPAVQPASAPAAPIQPDAKQKSDAGLAARVRAALDAEPQIHGFAIDVTADNGKVALFGTVHTKARRDKAEQIAKGISGVKSVDNNLAIVAGS